MGSQTWMGSHSLTLVHFTLSECGKRPTPKQVPTRHAILKGFVPVPIQLFVGGEAEATG